MVLSLSLIITAIGSEFSLKRLRKPQVAATLIIGEFALALSLLAVAGLAMHSFWNLTRVDLGVRTDHVLTFRLVQREGRFQNPEQMFVYNQRILDAIRSVSGVTAGATVTGMPLRFHSDGITLKVVGATYADRSQQPGAGFQSVSPDYFKTFGIQVLKGACSMNKTPQPVCG